MYDFKKIEQEVTEYWKAHDIYAKAQAKNKHGKVFYFLDGPPYTSGRVHLGTAWNKTLKDTVLRYKRMRGFNVWDRAGYDMHGLPTAHKVEEKLGIKHREEIEKYGVDKFITECRKLSVDNMKLMNEDFRKLGVWMDFDNAYQSVKNEFIEGVWWLVKRAHENDRLYEDSLAMTWCGHCETALAKHELEYETLTDDSIFVKFKLIGSDNEYLIIWTTTPWTIPFNLGVMANPELEYVRARVGDETWIVALALANTFIRGVAGKDFEIKETFTGDKLHGLKYEHPFHALLPKIHDPIIKKSDKACSVVLSEEYVDTIAGTGLVHMAPGCGPEDYEVGHREGIPAFNNLNEEGVFPAEMGPFAGLVAKKDDKKFIAALKDHGSLIATTKVEHEYAHCWRCHNPVIYRTTTQWFFKVEDLRENMRELNKEIYWCPDYAGSRSFDSWLKNLRDNGISRQRFWGTPLPVWRCEKCKQYDVIGSAEELKKKVGKLPEDFHKPWIDELHYHCECGGEKRRVPDILDVWIDAGSASWICLNYPARKDLFTTMYPADFILEGIDQIRGWFNMLFVASMVSMQKPSFKAVYMHGFINDALGRKMSKSLGNYILPEEVLSKYGVDTLRYYMIGGAAPGLDLNYNFEDMKLKFRNLGVLWNLHEFLTSSSQLAGINPARLRTPQLDIEERYIFSKLHSTIARVTELFDAYNLPAIPVAIEELYLELSRTYIQLVRDKLGQGSQQEKEAVLYTLYHVLLGSIQLLAPVAPFITEKMYQQLRAEYKLDAESIHLNDWPRADQTKVDTTLEQDFDVAKTITQKVLHGREKLGLGVRWPMQEAVIVTKDDAVAHAVEHLRSMLMVQTNMKEIKLAQTFPAKVTVKADYKKLAPQFAELTPQIIAQLTQMSSATIIHHLEKDGKLELTLGKTTAAITKEHLMIEKTPPDGYSYIDFNRGDLYLKTELTPELEAEGFIREVARRVQDQRKQAGLNKKDQIRLYVQHEAGLADNLAPHTDTLKEKVGAATIVMSSAPPTLKFDTHAVEEIRKRRFEIFFSKV